MLSGLSKEQRRKYIDESRLNSFYKVMVFKFFYT